MTLFASARNPIPTGAVSGSIRTPDGLSLRFARWDASMTPHRGTVCICQGRAEFIEKYFEVVDDLRRRGFAVVAFDWRGQGLSQRQLGNPCKGHVQAFRDYDTDLAAIVAQVMLPNCQPPFYALGHSMGGHVLVRHAASAAPAFARMVLSAPMIDIAQQRLGTPHWLARLYAESACVAGLGRIYTLGGVDMPLDLGDFDVNELTSDRERFMRTNQVVRENPQLSLGAPTICWLRAALRSAAHLNEPDFARTIKVPMLIFAAGDDSIASTPAIEAFAARLKLGALDLIPDAKHEILMETDAIRRRFWAGFDAYLEVDLAKPA